MENIRYLLDENVDPTVRTELLQFDASIDVTRVGDPNVPELSTPDEDILIWIEEKGNVLVTHNRKSMPIHLKDHFAQNRQIPGIFLIKRGVSIGRLVEELAMIWAASEADEYVNTIQYIPL